VVVINILRIYVNIKLLSYFLDKGVKGSTHELPKIAADFSNWSSVVIIYTLNNVMTQLWTLKINSSPELWRLKYVVLEPSMASHWLYKITSNVTIWKC